MKTILTAGAAVAVFWAGAAVAQTTAAPAKPVAVNMPTAPAAAPRAPSPDRDGDGRLNRAEYQAAREGEMVRFDTNRDGNIMSTEVEAAEDAAIAGDVADQFKILDANGDGSISKAEMTAVIKAKVRTQRGSGLGPMDADKNGVLTKAEIDSSADKDFVQIDANHDGFISREEMAVAQGMVKKAAPTKASVKPAVKSAPKTKSR